MDINKINNPEVTLKMKKIFIAAFILIISFFTTQSYVFAQDSTGNNDMQAFMKYMTPAKEHKMLEKFNGEWDFQMKIWMNPDGPPSTASGSAKFEMILGGRYQLSHQDCKVMGMPMNGMNIVGFDNAKKVFMNLWIDNMGTGMMYCEGTYDEQSKTFNYRGKSVNPVSGKDEDFRQLMKCTDENNFSIETYMIKDGIETKSMEISYTRK